MRSPLVPAALTGCALVLLLGACTSGGDTPSGDESLSYEDSPLSAYFEKLGGSPEDADIQAQAREAEELVAACMQELGFEYQPQDVSQMISQPEDSDLPDWDSLEFAEQYGYGATTGEDLSQAQPSEEWVDPNAEYVAAMSEGEQAAYYEALYGKQDEMPAEGEEIEYDWTTAGCQGEAQHTVYEEGQVWDDPEYKELMDELTDLYTRSQDSEDVKKAAKDWQQCMADAGFDFDDPEAAQNSIYEAHSQIPFAEDGTQDAAALAELKEKELATAVADRTCQIDVDYTNVQMRAQFAMEQEFIDEHKAELDSMVAKAESAGK